MKNNIKTVNYVLKYAHTVYNNFVQEGIWDKCINATPGQSGLLAQAAANTVAEGYTCFNCGKKGHHKKENCPDPVNKERQKTERDKFNLEKGRPQQSAKFNNKGKEIPQKWREPEASENNKRVIDTVPHTYNKAMKGWVPDTTPVSGAAANITTTHLEEIKQLKAENLLLKTDIGNLGATSEKSANYTRGQALLNTPTEPTLLEKQAVIRAEMDALREKFLNL